MTDGDASAPDDTNNGGEVGVGAVQTDIQHIDTDSDEEVASEFTADEVFDFYGECVERETTVALLEDGGVHIVQSTDQGTYDSLTLSEAVADELIAKRESSEKNDDGHGDQLGEGEEGLYEKYEVTKHGSPVESCFVLEPANDPTARAAISIYAALTDDEVLADDLRMWMDELEGDKVQDNTGKGWKFESGEIVREKHAKPSPVPGESESPKQEYKIKRQLVAPTNGDRFYQVIKPEGGTHLYSDGVMGRFVAISEEESRVWPREEEGGVF